MTFKEYADLYDVSGNVTFIIAKAEKEESSPFYITTYHTTPIRYVSEWRKTKMMDYIILNDHQCPIDWLSGANWTNGFNKGWLDSMVVISYEDLTKMFSKEQADHMIQFIDEQIKKAHS